MVMGEILVPPSEEEYLAGAKTREKLRELCKLLRCPEHELENRVANLIKRNNLKLLERVREIVCR